MSKRRFLSLLPAAALSLAALAIFLTSCGTMRNVVVYNPGKNCRVFGGVRGDVQDAVECVADPPAAKAPDADPAGGKTPETGTPAAKMPNLRSVRWFDLAGDVIDAPFSVAGDILTLPWVAYVRVREFAERHQQSSQQPTPAEKP
jgi:hypothetical protein